MKELDFYHRGSLGDVIYSLPTLLSYDSKINLYLRTHPHVDFLRRLLMSQDFIIDVKHRMNMVSNNPYVNLSGFVKIALKKKSQRLIETHLELHNRTYDFTTPWIKDIDPVHFADIIINRTKRYHDIEQIDWKILERFKDRCAFVGHANEWKIFVEKYKLNIKYKETVDGLEVAKIIKGSKFFIGNQSSCFSIAEAMKHPRSLEVNEEWDNCRPSGDDGYTYLDKDLIERHLDL